ncbi:MAG: hypothetical protein E6Q89_08875 [Bacteroidia bacterium]|nr:MAG: hypothetical protein E6Q89_08875 [Bacteroidia bacterium]
MTHKSVNLYDGISINMLTIPGGYTETTSVISITILLTEEKFTVTGLNLMMTQCSFSSPLTPFGFGGT